MPQPLSRVMPNASVMIGNAGDRPLVRHSQLAALAIEAIASWSNVENFMLEMFVCLLGGNESLATDIFLSLQNQSAKSAAINAAADTVLKEKPDELAILKAIMVISKTNEKSRNKLAHWTWGDSPNIPDGLLLINPKCGYGLRFNFILQGHAANRDSKLLAELKEEPEIQERLK